MTANLIKEYFYVCLVSFVATSVLLYLVRFISHQFELLDALSERKIHQQPTPRLGGVAIFISTFSVFLLAGLQSAHHQVLLLGGFGSFLLGFYDDLKGISSRAKLVAQIAIGGLVFFFGFQISSINLGFMPSIYLGPLSLPVTIFWVVACMNAVNIIDGLDTLCAGIVTVGTLCLLLLSGELFLAIFLASLVGFIVYNYPPASIFMGDGGSYFIGFLVAFYSATVFKSADGSFLIPAGVLLLGVPFADTGLAIVRRWFAGIPIFSADDGHIHHCLLRRGFSKKQTMFLLVGAQTVFSSTAYLLIGGGWLQIVFAFLACVLILVALSMEVLSQLYSPKLKT